MNFKVVYLTLFYLLTYSFSKLISEMSGKYLPSSAAFTNACMISKVVHLVRLERITLKSTYQLYLVVFKSVHV